MGWATNHIRQLQAGVSVSFRPTGGSMRPIIESGQLVTVEPVKAADVKVEDVVLCSVRGSEYLHLVKAIRGDAYLIGNNRGGVNGWIGPKMIFGRMTKVEP